MSTRISDILRSPNNEPLAGITIRLVATETSGKVVKTVVAEVTTAADGRYTLDVPAGLYDVYLERYGHRKEKAGTIRIYDDSPANTLNYYLEAPKDAPVPSWIRLIETSTSEAKTAAGEAGASASAAKASADDAEASHLKVKAIASDVGKAITDNISSSAPQAGKVPRSNAEGKTDANWLAATAYARTEADMEAMRAANREQYAASGPVHMGKHSSGSELPINQGLHTPSNTTANQANTLRWGRAHDNGGVGESKTDYPVFHIAGFEAHLSGVGLDDSGIVKNIIHFPQAPDGTVTYDSSTGKVTNFMTDVDPRYGDVASSRSEAVARAWEGEIKNGDFRKGADDWTLGTTCSISGGILTFSEADSASVTQHFEWDESATYEIEIDVKSITKGGLTLFKYGVGSTDSIIISMNKAGLYRVIFNSGSATGNFSSDNLFNIHSASGVKTSAEVNYVSIRKVTNEVVTNRVDLFGIEFFLRKVDSNDPWLYPYGCLCSHVSSIDGVALQDDDKPDSYHAMYEGQTNDIYRKALNISTANDVTLATFMANPKNNVFRMANGDLVQWTIRARTIAGAGNGNWEQTDVTNTAASYAKRLAWDSGVYSYLSPQGANDTVSTNNYLSPFNTDASSRQAGIWHTNNTDDAYNGECYFYVVGTVPRLNQGAYHPSLNPMGACPVRNQDNNAYIRFYEDTSLLVSVKGCFDFGDGAGNVIPGYSGKIGTASGRPDKKLYDAIYTSGQGGFIDERLKFGAWDASGTEKAAVVREELENGTYRGREKLIKTQFSSVYKGYFQAENSGHARMVTESGGNSGLLLHNNGFPSGTSLMAWQPDSGLVGYGSASNNDGYIRVSPFRDHLGKTTHMTGWMTKSSVATTSPWYIAKVEEINLTVEGQFTQTDVIGDPAEILKIPALANGWLGSWIPTVPNGTSLPFTLSRLTSDITAGSVGTTDHGSNWSNATPTIKGGANGFTSGPSTGQINLISYSAFAKKTVISANKVVLYGESGLSNIYAFKGNYHIYGAALFESVLDNVGLGRVAPVSMRVTLTQFYIDPNVGLLYVNENAGYFQKHNTIDLGSPTVDGHAFKSLFHPIDDNGLISLNIISNELIHNGTDWGDDSTMKLLNGTFTDKNGKTCKSSIHKLAKPYGWIKNER